MTLIDQLKENSTRYPEKTAVVCGESRISYHALAEAVNALARFLMHAGLKKGDRVGFLLPKTPEVIVAFLGVAKAGGVIFPVDFNQPPDKIDYLLNLTKPSVLIVSAAFQSVLSRLTIGTDKIKIVAIGSLSRDDCYSWDEIINKKAGTSPGPEIKEEDPVYLNFTSGSTGTPKGAVTTHAHIYWNTRSVVENLTLTPDDVYLCGFPVFSHPHEIFSWAFFVGGTTVLTDDVLPKTIASAVSKHKVTCMLAIALVYENLVRYGASPDELRTLRIAESGGMNVCPALVEDFKTRFGVQITQGWGSTETTGITVSISPNFEYRPDSIGKPGPYYEAKIVDENGNELPAGEVGEMLIKGPAVCTEYYNNPQETATHMREGWMHTGDMVKKDSEGYFYFLSRKTHMIKVAGLRVYPSEIEDVLNAHPQVVEAAVVKIQDETLGEVPRAVVVLKENMKVTEGELRKYCAKKMAKYKVPATIQFVAALPKTPGGKILYRDL